MKPTFTAPGDILDNNVQAKVIEMYTRDTNNCQALVPDGSTSKSSANARRN